MQLNTKRLTIRRVVEDDWKGLQQIWRDFSRSEYARYDRPHAVTDEEVLARVSK